MVPILHKATASGQLRATRNQSKAHTSRGASLAQAASVQPIENIVGKRKKWAAPRTLCDGGGAAVGQACPTAACGEDAGGLALGLRANRQDASGTQGISVSAPAALAPWRFMRCHLRNVTLRTTRWTMNSFSMT